VPENAENRLINPAFGNQGAAWVVSIGFDPAKFGTGSRCWYFGKKNSSRGLATAGHSKFASTAVVRILWPVWSGSVIYAARRAVAVAFDRFTEERAPEAASPPILGCRHG